MEILDFPYLRLFGAAGRPVRQILVAVALALSLVAVGCAGGGTRRPTESTVTVPASPRVSTAEVDAPAPADGVDHVVRRGQTLWRISKVYGVEIEELARANGISDTSSLDTGQVLFVPGAAEVLEVPAYPAPLGSASAVAPESGKWLWPVKHGEVLSYFGAPRRTHQHQGIDIRGRAGQPVRATRPGRVTYSGSGMRGYGKTVIVDHGHGLSSLYAHNSSLLVHKGQRVERGDVIAKVGRSGNASTEHCHFEIRRRDKPVDPLGYLRPTREARR
jgi:murein DD-endopeptidase MepM/ murein hydrolase activator NlpD